MFRGEAALLSTCRRCYASLFYATGRSTQNARASTTTRFGTSDRRAADGAFSDIGGSGVMFSIDTEVGLRQGCADQRRLGLWVRSRGKGGCNPRTNTKCFSRCSTSPASSRL